MKKFVVFLIVLILLFIIACIPVSSCSQTFKLLSLDFHETLQGIFFLGSGTLEGNTYYFFYTEDEKGESRLRKVPYYRVSFYQDGGKVAILDKDCYAWELHIPKNSIKENYTLN